MLFPINHSSIILAFEAVGCVNNISTQNTWFDHDKWVLFTMIWRFLSLRMVQTQILKLAADITNNQPQRARGVPPSRSLGEKLKIPQI
jgi:hypothetical protein